MKKILLCLSLFSLASTTHTINSKSSDKKNIIKIFGTEGLNVGAEILLSIIKLNTEIQNSSPLIIKKAIQYAMQDLLQNKNAKDFIGPIAYLKGQSPEPYNLFSAQDQELGESISRYIKTIAKRMESSTKEEIKGFQQLVKKYPLPTTLNVWQGTYIQNDKQVVVAQNMLVDMAIMIGTQYAVSAAGSWVDSMDSVFFALVQQAISNVTTSFSAFQASLSSFEQTKLNSALNNFSDAKTQIANDTQAASANYQAEIDYLSKMTNLDYPKEYYLAQTLMLETVGLGSATPTLDVQFEKGIMYTPSGSIWHNPLFVGDWEYDVSSQSFWQYNIVDTYQSSSFTKAQNNYIFTEFNTNDASYNITCDITLYNLSYPFFSGIIFNNNRWISGYTNGVYKYRLVGIYGKSETEAAIYYADYYIDGSTIQYPLSQIINETAQKLGDVDTSGFSTIKDTELTYSFDITNAADKVSIVFGEKNKDQTTTTATPKDTDLFIYHGVGFISPGAVSQFSLTKPDLALFTSDAIESFQNEVNALTDSNTAAAA